MAEPDTFDLARLEVAGHPLLVIYGELDALTTPVLHETLTAILEERPAVLLIDLANVSFLDSIALGALVVAQRHLAEYGGELRLVAVAPNPARVFQVTGLAERFHIFPDTDSATAPPPAN